MASSVKSLLLSLDVMPIARWKVFELFLLLLTTGSVRHVKITACVTAALLSLLSTFLNRVEIKVKMPMEKPLEPVWSICILFYPPSMPPSMPGGPWVEL